jgi:hypothetical protein
MRRKTKAGLLVGLMLALAVAVPAASQARTLYGTTSGGKLITFDDKQSKVKVKTKKGAKKKPPVKAVQIKATRTVNGLPAGVRIVGIDVRPLTGELYGVGSNNLMYRMVITGEKTALALAAGPLAPATLSGAFFGVDFNPVPDRLRIVSDTGQNLRADPNGTTAASTGPAPGATQAPTATDGALNPGTPKVVAAAYLNSSYSAVKPTTTTLFVVDTSTDTLFTQNPPNNGTLTAGVKLSVAVGNDVGFDIAGPANQPYLVDGSSLYKVTLATGAATKVGDIGTVTKKGKVKKASLTGLAAVQD